MRPAQVGSGVLSSVDVGSSVVLLSSVDDVVDSLVVGSGVVVAGAVTGAVVAGVLLRVDEVLRVAAVVAADDVAGREDVDVPGFAVGTA